MDTPSYDVIVIGAGAAGLTAATEAARAGLKALCLDKLAPGGELVNLGPLYEFDEVFNGPQMCERLTDDATVAGAEIGFGEVSAISGTGPFVVEISDGEKHTTRSVVIATGLNKGKLGVPGEAEYEGRGLSHCATCDGPLYAGQAVVVTAGSFWAAFETMALVGIADSITFVGTPSIAVPDGVKVVDGRVVGLEGEDGLQSVVVESNGVRNVIPANAIFVYAGQSPAAEFLPDSLARDASGHIVADSEGRTSVPLIFAAGDVRAGSREYLADAIADGQKVAKTIVAALKE
jgi:thioredoxin reductase (NADPH)